MDIEAQRDKITEQLEMLNSKIGRQNSIKYIFTSGIIHGVGFFIGSAIVATILFGLLSPWIGQIGWIRDSFERGASLR